MSKKKGAEKKEEETDKRLGWIKARVKQTFPHVKTANFNKLWTLNSSSITLFLDGEVTDEEDYRALFVIGDNLAVSYHLPEVYPQKSRGIYFVKRQVGTVEKEDMARAFIYGELSEHILHHFEVALQEIFVPLAANAKNKTSWGGDLAQKEMSEIMRSVLSKVTIAFGESQGQTRLPLPPVGSKTDDTPTPSFRSQARAPLVKGKAAAIGEKFGSAATSNERVHLFESAVVTWTKQIKKVLELDAEQAMKDRGPNAPPEQEIRFWETKARKLNSIFEQLQRDRVRKILRFLDLSKSTYCAPFARLCKEVFAARVEANDNAKFLHTLDPWFRKMDQSKWEELPELFVPMLHIILLVWKNSRCYNSAPRLVVLMWQICNALIRKAGQFISGSKIFGLLAEEEAAEAVEKIKSAVQICNMFKHTYFEYKTTADAECPSNSWRIPNEAIFGRLDAYMERLHDVHDLTQTVIQLERLEKIEIGGSKGGEQTETLQNLYEDFKVALSLVEALEYDICNIDAPRFDKDYNTFKATVNNIEIRLGSLLIEAFDLSPSLYSRFQLLQGFDNLLERPNIADCFERRHVVLLEQCIVDLKASRSLFVSQRDYPPIPANLPPISGAITWSTGVSRRIKDSIRRLSQMPGIIMQREEAQEVIRMEQNIRDSIDEYVMQKIEEWGRDVETTSHAKLKLPLLKKSRDTGNLIVNFDRDLIRLLREVKYFLVLELPVPDSALQIYEHGEIYRRQRLSLDMICNVYNRIQGLLLPVERPLVKSHVSKFDASAQKGIKELTWKSDSVDDYIVQLQKEIDACDKVVQTLKDNLAGIEEIMASWVVPLMERIEGDTIEAADLIKHNQPLNKEKYGKIKDGGKAIHKFVKASNKAVKVSQASPDWKSYVDFVNDVVVDGLAQATICSLGFVVENLELKPLGDVSKLDKEEDDGSVPGAAATGEEGEEPVRRRKKDFVKPQAKPIVMIRLHLQGDKIVFLPDLGETSKKKGITDLVNGWVSTFVGVAALVKRIDGSGGSYVKELQNNLEVRSSIARVDEYLNISNTNCIEFYQIYESYSHLFLTSIKKYFENFLEEATVKEPVKRKSALAKKKKKENKGPPEYKLKLFDAEIVKYTVILHEIQELPVLVNLGWLLADPLPIKQALLTYANQWITKFTGFLLISVQGSLQTMFDFIAKAKEGLDLDIDPNNIDQEKLMEVMGVIRDIRKNMTRVGSMVGPLREQCAMLKKHGMDVDSIKVGPKDPETGELMVPDDAGNNGEESDDEQQGVDLTAPIEVLEYLDALPTQWQKLVDISFERKAAILPLQQKEVANIKEKLDQFFLDVRAFRNDFRKNAPFKFQGLPVRAFEQLDGYEEMVRTVAGRISDFSELEELFELPAKKYTEIEDTQRDLFVLKMVWDFHDLVGSTYAKWKEILYHDIDVDNLLKLNKKLSKQIRKFGGDYPIAKQWQTYRDVEQMTKDMDIVLPIVQELNNPAMKQRHWKMAAKVCNVDKIEVGRPDFCLGDLWDLNLPEFGEEVLECVETATKEAKIEKKLKMISEVWAGLCLDYKQYKETDIMMILVSEEVMEALETHQMELQSMIGMGKFVEFFKKEVSEWQKTLGNVEETLKVWNIVMKAWASLESIFLESADIRNQLPDDTKRFEGIDESFKDLQAACTAEPNVAKACASDGRTEALKSMQADLELCQKALNDYLDRKKKEYPRFYFVSTRALLDILSNGNNPPRIMRNLTDCYGGIKTMVFKPADPSVEGYKEGDINKNRAIAMIAIDGERVEMPEEFEIKGEVQVWLNAFTQHMKLTVCKTLEHAIGTATDWRDPEAKPRQAWLFDYPAQCAITTTQIFWTEETETSLDEYEGGAEDAVKKYLQRCTSDMHELIKLVYTKLSKPDRKKVISLITMDVHARDMVDKLVKEKAASTLAFTWQMQMRLYFTPEDGVTSARIIDYRTFLSYEYLGNTGRLVITPLTDRCYITLCTALKLMLSGAPAGPAGTGKTETVKDLSRCFQIAIYVFNGSPQMNYQTIGDIFKGLAQSGTWGCFDEFNRISIEVLSVVATQVQCLQEGIKLFSVIANREEKYRGAPPGMPPEKVGSVTLMGDLIGLIPTIGIYITMNPGYAGRTALPENLKTLFRSCAMIRPDLAIICEIMLMAEGFFEARVLAVKFIELYTLSGALLSPQPHYDWGLRAVRSVLVVAGILKRASPEEPEEQVLMRALRDFNTPKIPAWDIPIFMRLMADLFPQYIDSTPIQVDEDLKKKAITCAIESGLSPHPQLIAKVIQFQELLDVRHSVMLLGPAGCGKTVVWETLLNCHNVGHSKRVAIAELVNPKAITVDELYGYMTFTKDWRDGALSIIMRGMSKDDRDLGYGEHQTTKWVVLDGDIDTLWIESMNTVMDDNKMLTLVSNERIPLTPCMRMIFEIDSLQNASPATVTRAGILFINETDIGWKPIMEVWCKNRSSKAEKAVIPGLFEKYIATLQDVTRSLIPIVPVVILSKITMILSIIQGMLDPIEEDKIKTPEFVENIFVFAVVWAFGGLFIDDKTQENATMFDEIFQNNFGDIIPVDEDDEGNLLTVFDYVFLPEKKEWAPWTDFADAYEHTQIGEGPGERPFDSIFVETPASKRLEWIINSHITQKTPLMLVGLAGSGKTEVVTQTLSKLDRNKYLTNEITANYYMEHLEIQREIEGAIDKRSGRIFGPAPGKRMVYFVDDFNLPFIEDFGTQSAHSLVRMIINFKNLFDRDDLSFRKEFEDLQFMCAMNPTSGSFTVAQRVQRHYSCVAVAVPTAAQCAGIFTQITTGHLSDFSSEVQSIGASVMQCLFETHAMVTAKFLPSSIKFMYNWNLRELNNAVKGLCRTTPKETGSPTAFTRVFVHEMYRVYRDRMVSLRQEAVFNDLFMVEFTRVFGETALKDKLGELTNEDTLMMTTFCAKPGGASGIYQEIENVESLSLALEAKLEEYNENFSIMELVLFKQAMQHVTRIARVINTSGGNVMLVGVGGSGKQSLSRLAGYVCGMEIVQLQISGKFSTDDFKEALQIMFKTAGVAGKPLLYLMTDSQVVNDKFLVFLSNMLSTGWIPGLFPKEEIDNILGSIQSAAKQHGIADDPTARMNFFIQRVKKNLHLSLCFSPVGNVFRIRARRFPALVNCTVIDQFHPWPREALYSVAGRFLEELEVEDAEVLPKLAAHMAHCHLSVAKISDKYKEEKRRYNYVTPKSFLELIAFYKTLLDRKTKAIMTLIDRLDIGLSIIKKTNDDVGELRKDLEHTMEKVREKTEATNALLKHMAVEKEKADIALASAAIEAEAAGVASKAAEKIQVEADKELAKAKPAMDAANEAVNCLDKNSLNELKGFATPPGGVPDVTGAVLMMLEGEFKNHSWDRAKKMMSNLGQFLEKLQTYDAENMPEALVQKMLKAIENPMIDYEVMLAKSSAAANLAAWVVNVVAYNRIYVKVKPLMDALEDSMAAKMAAEESLQTANIAVDAANKILADLREALMAATVEKQEVEKEKIACQAKLALAERLLNGLASEGKRWGNDIKLLEVEKTTMLGDVLLASAFVSYIGPFDASYRNEIWRNLWMADIIERGIPLTEGIDVKDILTNSSTDAKNMNEGLPADRMSLENGAIVSQCKRWPFLIDPQLQGVRWLYGKEGGEGNADNLMLIQFSNADWVKKMSYAVQNGKTVIVENCPVEIDATMDPILSRQLTKKGSSLFINFASEDIEYDRNFKLYLQTKLANPHFKPELFAQCTLINFIATEAGLEDQLLAMVVNVERPELEQQKQELVAMFNRFKVELKDLEDDLLERLANAPEDILSDLPLIEGLEKTKAASEEIAIAVDKAKKTEIDINAAREEYRPAASESSMLYFLITDLWQIDHMYRYSLGAYTKFFFKAIARTPEQENITARVAALRSNIRFTIFTWVSRGLAKKHKLIYMCQLAFKMMARGDLGDASEEFKPSQLNFLLKAPKDDSKENKIPWLSRGAWQTVCGLMNLEGFGKLGDDLDEASSRFEEWYNHVTPELEKLPMDWAQLDRKPFLKLLVIRTLRPDRMTIAMVNWLAVALPDGRSYTEADASLSPVGMLEAAIADSAPDIPIFFILSPGADVVAVVDQCAAARNLIKGKNYHNTALGQGQDVIAMGQLQVGHVQGHWLILNNIHLMPRWLVECEKQLDTMAMEGSHQNFRLFLTSEPTPYDPARCIPIGILARSIKLTMEAPTGLNANLKRGFNFFDPDDFDELDNRSKSIMFGLCHFHAIFLERKKFGPKGFNMMYPFSLGDLRDAANCLNNYMENAPSQIPWADLKYLFGEIIYGGHIVNDGDRLLANTYLDFYMRDELLGIMEMFPFVDPTVGLSFRSMQPSTHENYNKYFDNLSTESPLAFGLHPNAEIGFRTVLSEDLFARLLELQPRDASAAGGEEEAVTPESVGRAYKESILIRFEDSLFDMYEVDQALEDVGKGPYQNVFIQECNAMNVLMTEIKRSLVELGMGFAGELTMSEKMEELMGAMFLDRIPDTWMNLAWASVRPLASWLIDCTARCTQLQAWCDAPAQVPRVTWLSGFRNPTSFLTAIKQVIAQKEKRELDKLIVMTEVTSIENAEKVGSAAPRGAYLYGFCLDGARWNLAENVTEASKPKEMFCPMPVINCAALPTNEVDMSGLFLCPCYKTMSRGPTWVFDAQLKTKDPPAKWILAGVALILDVGE